MIPVSHFAILLACLCALAFVASGKMQTKRNAQDSLEIIFFIVHCRFSYGTCTLFCLCIVSCHIYIYIYIYIYKILLFYFILKKKKVNFDIFLN